jgi:hypothetical protein
VSDPIITDAILDNLVATLKGNRWLDPVKTFIRGYSPEPLSLDQLPSIEIVIDQETPDDGTSGETHHIYAGLLTLTIRAFDSEAPAGDLDWLQPISDRYFSVRSYDRVRLLAWYIVLEFSEEDHLSLSNLSVTRDGVTEVVRAFRLTGPRIYEVAGTNRNNYEHSATIGFIVETDRSLPV